MTTVEVFKIEEVGADYLSLRDGVRHVRISFADDEMFSKEDSAGFFRSLQDKPAAIPVNGPFFIAVDFWRDRFDGSLKVIPFHFAITSVERRNLLC
jgi:hypothetical protein